MPAKVGDGDFVSRKPNTPVHVANAIWKGLTQPNGDERIEVGRDLDIPELLPNGTFAMFKKTSDNAQFRLSPKGNYMSGDDDRWAFYARKVYEDRLSLDLGSWRMGRLEKVKQELDETGRLRTTRRWFEETLIGEFLGENYRKQLEHKYFVYTATKPPDE